MSTIVHRDGSRPYTPCQPSHSVVSPVCTSLKPKVSRSQASCDGSIRIWELDGSQQQLVEFELPSGCARCIAYHPTEYAIACGFDDGCVRIFDIASTSLLEEYKQHRGRVLAIGYTHSAQRLFSASADGGLCAYDVLHSYQPSRFFSASPHADSPCIAVASDDSLLAVGGLQTVRPTPFPPFVVSPPPRMPPFPIETPSVCRRPSSSSRRPR